MTIFLTGGTGFIGEKLALRLADTGDTVHVLHRSTSDTRRLRHQRIRLFEGDILDPESIGRAVRGCEQAYHLAAWAGVKPKSRQDIWEKNVIGTRNVVQTALKERVDRIVYASTAGVFGPCEDGCIDEETPLKTDFYNEYERSKSTVEEEVLEMARSNGRIVVVNPSRVYGPGQLSQSNGITRLIKCYLEGTWHIIPGNGSNIGNYAFVDDVVAGMMAAMEKGIPGERYLLGGMNASYDELFRILVEVTGMKRFLVRLPESVMIVAAHVMVFMTDRFGGAPMITPALVRKYCRDWRVSSVKACRDLGYRMTSLEEGLQRTVAWLKNPEGIRESGG